MEGLPNVEQLADLLSVSDGDEIMAVTLQSGARNAIYPDVRFLDLASTSMLNADLTVFAYS